MGENAQWVNGAGLQASTGCKYVMCGSRARGEHEVKEKAMSSTLPQ